LRLYFLYVSYLALFLLYFKKVTKPSAYQFSSI
jgi:hypothetical protein